MAARATAAADWEATLAAITMAGLGEGDGGGGLGDGKVSSLLGVTKVTQAKLPPPRTPASVVASVDLD